MIEKSRANYPRVRATLPQQLRGGSPPTRVPVKTGQIAQSRHPLFLFPPLSSLIHPFKWRKTRFLLRKGGIVVRSDDSSVSSYISGAALRARTLE
ncbi:hypothetical protein Q8A67_008563 [Cirrhinus molitorella]|uniref:Uncharacterized protein n=1 Tax=Cirrhinus molitorella TaxID=172907 RepID=A0AA88PXL6_9TELE|nr:hypothetical protein Q8A67_008563 [Cirrhinus molitorella]